MHNRSVVSWGVVGSAGAAAIVLLGLGACSGGAGTMDDPLRIMTDDQQTSQTREAAVKQARELAGTDPVAISAVTEGMEEVISSTNTPPEVRTAALTALLNDADPAVQQRGRAVIRKRLPTEDSPKLVALMCSSAAERGWDDCLPAIIHSYARQNAPGTTDADRTERAAIIKLRPGVSVEEAVFAVFAKPPEQEPLYGVDWTKRLQRDAWHVLCRLDATGDTRRALLRDVKDTNDRGTAALEAVRACEADLRASPNSGDELAWLLSLRNENGKQNAEWWRSASEAAAKAPASERLEIRHAEPLRWALANQPAWLSMSRSELMSVLTQRVANRRIIERSGQRKLYRESVHSQQDTIPWADCITILAIDATGQQAGNPQLLWQQGVLDREDFRGAYGGAWMPRRGSTVEYLPILYPPRAAQRRGDLMHIPTDDMIAQSDLTLAYYTFHAQETRNEDMAGPSQDDLNLAARLRRNYVVLTMIGDRRFDVDCLTPQGVVVDLGIVEAPR